jgi:hypothetical protein
MARTAVLTATGVIKAGAGQMFMINVTKAATGAGSITIYDNPSAASGAVLFQGDGLVQQCFMTGTDEGAVCSQGMYCVLAGTTNATLVVIYE